MARQTQAGTIEIDPFAIASDLLLVRGHTLERDDHNYILGSIRSRSFANLSQPFRSIGPDQRGTEETRTLSQIQALFKKNASFGNAKARESKTWGAFLNGESQCRIANRRLDFYLGLHPDRCDQDIMVKVKRMRHVIRDILGPLTACIDGIPANVRFTEGSTESATKDYSGAERKLCKRTGSCYAATDVLVKSLARLWDIPIRTRLVNENQIVMVPKQWDKDRTIAKEADWALPFQLAVDAHVRERLKGWGIDLGDQTRNQRLSLEGSLDGSIATIDLSAASDTVSTSVVEHLLPSDWWEFLRRLRAPLWRRGSRKKPLERGVYAKFSSMGNGVTFVLETLIFYAVCYACGASVASVYGDDICVSTEVAQDVIKLLQFLGFKTNVDKTFVAGPFRESCGVDYHNGVNVRPVFLKTNVLDAKDACTLINGIAPYALPGSALEARLHAIIRELDLPFVPVNDDSSNGIFVLNEYADRRWCSNLHRYEYQTLVYKSVSTRLAHKTIEERRQHWLFPRRDYWHRLSIIRNRQSVELNDTVARYSANWDVPMSVRLMCEGQVVVFDSAIVPAATTYKIRRRWDPLWIEGLNRHPHLIMWTMALKGIRSPNRRETTKRTSFRKG